ncbi:MAG TPA: ABC transporter ATP-binding protein [Hyphomicrobiales bacterium]|nr:ABC transporter ATP-binding protein [Hyphomicrobiales bacterium]
MPIRFEAVSFAYPGTQTGVRAIDLAVGDGELVALIGPSGSGKSTCLKLLAGFYRPDHGRINVDGHDVDTLSPESRRLGIVFQNYALFPHMSTRDNVAYPLKVRGVARAERRRTADEMLDRVGLSDLGDRAPKTLSGGQQQRVALARALVFKPRALLLDEPLSALDAGLRVAMRDEIRRVQREAGIATIHVTHDQEEALSIADRVVIMSDGAIAQIGKPDEVYDRPRTRFVARFVGQANFWQGMVGEENQVETPIGRLRHNQEGVRPGDKVLVLVRPERLDLFFENPKTPPPNYFKGHVTQDRFLGSIRRFDFAVAGNVIRVETRNRAAPRAVAIPPDAIRLLPPDDNENKMGELS